MFYTFFFCYESVVRKKKKKIPRREVYPFYARHYMVECTKIVFNILPKSHLSIKTEGTSYLN